VLLLHSIHLFADQLHLVDLLLDCSGVSGGPVRDSRRETATGGARRGGWLTLMLVVLGSAHLRVELGADLVEQVVDAIGAIVWGHGAHAAMGGIHGHGDGDGYSDRKAERQRRGRLVLEGLLTAGGWS